MRSAARLAVVLLGALGLMGALWFVLADTPSHSAGAAPLITPTPTYCPVGTPEPLWVEPVPSTTLDFSQVVTVYLGNGEAVTVVAESGVFAERGDFDAYGNPCLITVSLLSNTDHHLEVFGKVERINQGGCIYGGYTLRTTRDRYGQPLEISQRFTPVVTCYLPLIR